MYSNILLRLWPHYSFVLYSILIRLLQRWPEVTRPPYATKYIDRHIYFVSWPRMLYMWRYSPLEGMLLGENNSVHNLPDNACTAAHKGHTDTETLLEQNLLLLNIYKIKNWILGVQAVLQQYYIASQTPHEITFRPS